MKMSVQTQNRKTSLIGKVCGCLSPKKKLARAQEPPVAQQSQRRPASQPMRRPRSGVDHHNTEANHQRNAVQASAAITSHPQSGVTVNQMVVKCLDVQSLVTCDQVKVEARLCRLSCTSHTEKKRKLIGICVPSASDTSTVALPSTGILSFDCCGNYICIHCVTDINLRTHR